MFCRDAIYCISFNLMFFVEGVQKAWSLSEVEVTFS